MYNICWSEMKVRHHWQDICTCTWRQTLSVWDAVTSSISRQLSSPATPVMLFLLAHWTHSNIARLCLTEHVQWAYSNMIDGSCSIILFKFWRLFQGRHFSCFCLSLNLKVPKIYYILLFASFIKRKSIPDKKSDLSISLLQIQNKAECYTVLQDVWGANLPVS